MSTEKTFPASKPSRSGSIANSNLFSSDHENFDKLVKNYLEKMHVNIVELFTVQFNELSAFELSALLEATIQYFPEEDIDNLGSVSITHISVEILRAEIKYYLNQSNEHLNEKINKLEQHPEYGLYPSADSIKPEKALHALWKSRYHLLSSMMLYSGNQIESFYHFLTAKVYLARANALIQQELQQESFDDYDPIIKCMFNKTGKDIQDQTAYFSQYLVNINAHFHGALIFITRIFIDETSLIPRDSSKDTFEKIGGCITALSKSNSLDQAFLLSSIIQNIIESLSTSLGPAEDYFAKWFPVISYNTTLKNEAKFWFTSFNALIPEITEALSKGNYPLAYEHLETGHAYFIAYINWINDIVKSRNWLPEQLVPEIKQAGDTITTLMVKEQYEVAFLAQLKSENARQIYNDEIIKDIEQHWHNMKIIYGILKPHYESLFKLLQTYTADGSLATTYTRRFSMSFRGMLKAFIMINTGIIDHNHQTALGTVGSIAILCSGLFSFIPVTGRAITGIVSAAGNILVKVNHERTLQHIKRFAKILSEPEIESLASQLAERLTTFYLNHFSLILGEAPESIVESGKKYILAHFKRNIFDRITECFEQRFLLTLLEPSLELEKVIKDANNDVVWANLPTEERVTRVLQPLFSQLTAPKPDTVCGKLYSLIMNDTSLRVRTGETTIQTLTISTHLSTSGINLYTQDLAQGIQAYHAETN